MSVNQNDSRNVRLRQWRATIDPAKIRIVVTPAEVEQFGPMGAIVLAQLDYWGGLNGGWFTGSSHDLAAICGISDQQARRAVRKLLEIGAIEREKFGAKSWDHTLSYRRVEPLDPRSVDSDESRSVDSDESRSVDSDESSSLQDEKIKMTTPTPPRAEGNNSGQASLLDDEPVTLRSETKRRRTSPTSASFEAWWDRYPRKGRGGPGSRSRAAKEFEKQIRAGASVAELDRQLSNYRTARARFEEVTGEPCWLMAAPKWMRESRDEFDTELDDEMIFERWNHDAFDGNSKSPLPLSVSVHRDLTIRWFDDPDRRDEILEEASERYGASVLSRSATTERSLTNG